MSRNLEALRQRHEDVKFSGTLKGKLFNYGGRLFAIYCVVRVISVSSKHIQTQYSCEVAYNYNSQLSTSSLPLNLQRRLQLIQT